MNLCFCTLNTPTLTSLPQELVSQHQFMAMARRHDRSEYLFGTTEGLLLIVPAAALFEPRKAPTPLPAPTPVPP